MPRIKKSQTSSCFNNFQICVLLHPVTHTHPLSNYNNLPAARTKYLSIPCPTCLPEFPSLYLLSYYIRPFLSPHKINNSFIKLIINYKYKYSQTKRKNKKKKTDLHIHTHQKTLTLAALIPPFRFHRFPPKSRSSCSIYRIYTIIYTWIGR